MKRAATPVMVHWPNGRSTPVPPGSDWLQAAAAAGQAIPTGCLGGSCGACEIEVNGRVVRACIATVPAARSGDLRVELASDPYW
ncbi:2Fe-2S iron-sulfur cluster-binding protein [Synechococcus sp. RedBA-s]|uniref:2Fe-2S iron-sulfur cluster-binding protein n=1 Tax=Synechococcus sp. RedBA-s TaxID=2823741 RepID=UPI0020CD2A27|nr:2Fe-2S iron-sulfur cluster-binding protein [Synechococcus sp. RedBA-s]MCP9801045.1 2Fe-2S iron-sulfur cluster binding domain-containing protein [Synechococcus sp. RedBA-s]